MLSSWGSSPNDLSEACRIAEDYGYSEINLNLGCLAKKFKKINLEHVNADPFVAKCIEAMSKAINLKLLKQELVIMKLKILTF